MLFFIFFLAGVILFYLFHYFPFTTCLALFSCLIILVFRKKYLLIPVIAAGVIYAFFRYAPEPDFSRIRDREMLVSGTFSSEPIQTSYGKSMQTFHSDSAVDAETEEALDEMGEEDITVISDSEFEIGSRYEIRVRAGKDNTRLSPGVMTGDNLYANLIEASPPNYDKGGEPSLWALFQNTRARLNRYIANNFSADSGALISSITTGQRVNMSEELRDAFNSTGLAHILSISGTHFGLFSVFLFGIFRFLLKHLPYWMLQRLTIYITPSQGAAVICLPFMLAYLALSGWSIPAIRSFIMVSLFLAGLLIGRKGFWLNSLLFAAFVVVLWSPDALFSLSFQLSFIAVLFIGFSLGYMEEDKENPEEQKNKSLEVRAFWHRYSSSALQLLRSSILLTLAASLGTAPLVAYHFHYLSVISPLTNLFITPLIGFVLLPLSLLSSFIFLLTDYYFFAPLIQSVAGLTVYLVMNAARLPFADIKIPAFPVFVIIVFYAGCILYLLLDKKKYAIMIFSALIISYLLLPLFRQTFGANVTYLDVGQGDAAVIETSGGKAIAVDTGKTGRELEAYLKYRGKKTIDALIISHADNDHSGGVMRIIKKFKVREVWDNGLLIYPDGILKNAKRRSFERGDVITSEDVTILVLHPYKEFYTMHAEHSEDNNSSLVLKLTGRGKSFLFAGDAAEEAEEDMAYLGKWLKSDVIKVPHHGGKTSAHQVFFSAVSPEIAVISVGSNNSYGHPHAEMLRALGNIKIYRTDRDGAIKITEKENGLEAKAYRDFQYAKAKTFSDEMGNIKRLFSVW